MEQKYIVVYGNLHDGFTFKGPYETREQAAAAQDSVDTDWWVAPLETVGEEA